MRHSLTTKPHSQPQGYLGSIFGHLGLFRAEASGDVLLWARFQRHEWEKHGQCAGVDDADDFFRQVGRLRGGGGGLERVVAGARRRDSCCLASNRSFEFICRSIRVSLQTLGSTSLANVRSVLFRRVHCRPGKVFSF